ncbi:glycosyltransferase family 1 protein [Polynucleobacter paneuropaeus]|nr:glycosyltransferase family 1 protein [Polynucleobacter paneuropaeus]
MYKKTKNKKILIAHSNTGAHVRNYHNRRELAAKEMGFKLETLSMADFFPYMTFPKLDRLWKMRDKQLMNFYELLGNSIDNSDIFIHLNGSGIHPDFLSQFRQLKIYHCADDPEASELISKPVASAYDIHAISNPACLQMYRDLGCHDVFFWPLGSPRYIESNNSSQIVTSSYTIGRENNATAPVVYVGSKYGTARFRYISKVPFSRYFNFLWMKKRFFLDIEERFASFSGYGEGWKNGLISDDEIERLYQNCKIGINVHNSLGPINERLYDLAAFGVCQICDNKERLDHVFKEGVEIIGFSTEKECFDLIEFYLHHPNEAKKIGAAARARFLKDYTIEALWLSLVSKIEAWLENDASEKN